MGDEIKNQKIIKWKTAYRCLIQYAIFYLVSKYQKLNEGIASIIQDFGLVSFIPLNIADKEVIHKVLAAVDKALGYTPSNQEEEITHQVLNAAPEEDVDEYLKAV